MNHKPFTIERTFNAPVSTVWKAITDKNEMKKWYFDLPDFKADVGFEFQFPGGPAPDRQYLHLCQVTEVVPGKKLAYTWSYQGYEGTSMVIFELFPEGQKTRLLLTHSGLENFISNKNPDLDAKNFEAGWTQIIGASLENYLKTN